MIALFVLLLVSLVKSDYTGISGCTDITLNFDSACLGCTSNVDLTIANTEDETYSLVFTTQYNVKWSSTTCTLSYEDYSKNVDETLTLYIPINSEFAESNIVVDNLDTLTIVGTVAEPIEFNGELTVTDAGAVTMTNTLHNFTVSISGATTFDGSNIVTVEDMDVSVSGSSWATLNDSTIDGDLMIDMGKAVTVEDVTVNEATSLEGANVTCTNDEFNKELTITVTESSADLDHVDVGNTFYIQCTSGGSATTADLNEVTLTNLVGSTHQNTITGFYTVTVDELDATGGDWDLTVVTSGGKFTGTEIGDTAVPIEMITVTHQDSGNHLEWENVVILELEDVYTEQFPSDTNLNDYGDFEFTNVNIYNSAGSLSSTLSTCGSVGIHDSEENSPAASLSTINFVSSCTPYTNSPYEYLPDHLVFYFENVIYEGHNMEYTLTNNTDIYYDVSRIGSHGASIEAPVDLNLTLYRSWIENVFSQSVLIGENANVNILDSRVGGSWEFTTTNGGIFDIRNSSIEGALTINSDEFSRVYIDSSSLYGDVSISSGGASPITVTNTVFGQDVDIYNNNGDIIFKSNELGAWYTTLYSESGNIYYLPIPNINHHTLHFIEAEMGNVTMPEGSFDDLITYTSKPTDSYKEFSINTMLPIMDTQECIGAYDTCIGDDTQEVSIGAGYGNIEVSYNNNFGHEFHKISASGASISFNGFYAVKVLSRANLALGGAILGFEGYDNFDDENIYVGTYTVNNVANSDFTGVAADISCSKDGSTFSCTPAANTDVYWPILTKYAVAIIVLPNSALDGGVSGISLSISATNSYIDAPLSYLSSFTLTDAFASYGFGVPANNVDISMIGLSNSWTGNTDWESIAYTGMSWTGTANINGGSGMVAIYTFFDAILGSSLGTLNTVSSTGSSGSFTVVSYNNTLDGSTLGCSDDSHLTACMGTIGSTTSTYTVVPDATQTLNFDGEYLTLAILTSIRQPVPVAAASGDVLSINGEFRESSIYVVEDSANYFVDAFGYTYIDVDTHVLNDGSSQISVSTDADMVIVNVPNASNYTLQLEDGYASFVDLPSSQLNAVSAKNVPLYAAKLAATHVTAYDSAILYNLNAQVADLHGDSVVRLILTDGWTGNYEFKGYYSFLYTTGDRPDAVSMMNVSIPLDPSTWYDMPADLNNWSEYGDYCFLNTPCNSTFEECQDVSAWSDCYRHFNVSTKQGSEVDGNYVYATCASFLYIEGEIEYEKEGLATWLLIVIIVAAVIVALVIAVIVIKFVAPDLFDKIFFCGGNKTVDLNPQALNIR
eukprot:gnl/Chilomastix_cuspidata/32.p1 GENE.gnl/Chilomastix_cuspidata/32~~gnl/Chilomastix_cuspidata/32.p1  ORF type:complete len:1291 (+),score=323.20 gnl/Chilomastix_cuspidata/32:24-3896(+)